MLNKTNNLMFGPNNTPPISPNDTGTLFLVSTNNRKDHNERPAISSITEVENSRPPLEKLKSKDLVNEPLPCKINTHIFANLRLG